MKKHALCLFLFASVLLCVPGCFSKPSVKQEVTIKAPKWVLTIPTDTEYVYSIGISGRTLYPTHAIKYATENARQELGNMISTKIVAQIRTHDQGRREDISIDSISVTDADLQGSQVVERWVDQKGISGVSPGTTYVLMRVERSVYEGLLRKYR